MTAVENSETMQQARQPFTYQGQEKPEATEGRVGAELALPRDAPEATD